MSTSTGTTETKSSSLSPTKTDSSTDSVSTPTSDNSNDNPKALLSPALYPTTTSNVLLRRRQSIRIISPDDTTVRKINSHSSPSFEGVSDNGTAKINNNEPFRLSPHVTSPKPSPNIPAGSPKIGASPASSASKYPRNKYNSNKKSSKFALPHYRVIHSTAHESIFSRYGTYSFNSSTNSNGTGISSEENSSDEENTRNDNQNYNNNSVETSSSQQLQKVRQRSLSFNQYTTPSSTQNDSNGFKDRSSFKNMTLESNPIIETPKKRVKKEDTKKKDDDIKFYGFRNLAMIVLVVGNIRLLIENYLKYGVITSVKHISGFSEHDIKISLLLTASIPLHLFISLLVERVAARLAICFSDNYRTASDELFKQKKLKADDDLKTNKAKKSSDTLISQESIRTFFKKQPFKKKHLWRIFAAIHLTNVILCIAITSYNVYTNIWHPALGTICEIHAVVVCLKVASYALTNRDLRDATLINMRAEYIKNKLKSQGQEVDEDEIEVAEIPELYSSQPYPTNLTISNLVYFWWSPTLVYQPVYPRTSHIRISFIARQLIELTICLILIWLLTSQYALPTLENSLAHAQDMNLILTMERTMKLATVSIIIWLLGFFCLFQSFLNLLAELTRFADRDFYQDWWNSGSLGSYWKLWNKPVSNYFRRHLYIPMLKRGWPQFQSSAMVFFVSAVLHEVLVGIPTHSILGVAFVAMIFQIPMILVTAPLEKMQGSGITIGNCIFWLSFFLGQPLGVLMYYFAWNLKYNPQGVSNAIASHQLEETLMAALANATTNETIIEAVASGGQNLATKVLATVTK